MSAQHRLPPQSLTEEDRQFDALLRRAAQHLQKVKVDMRDSGISREKTNIVARQTFRLPCA
jgi:hypothetical protein